MPQSRTRSPLRINPTPFRPTLLSIPPSPFSPRTPLTPRPRPYQYSFAQTDSPRAHSSAQPVTSAPSAPLAWTWQCHHCSRSYSLSATRRCLDDGHAFCSGTTTLKSTRTGKTARRTKRHGACKSEFDYYGWKGWGRWKRSSNTGRCSRTNGPQRDDCNDKKPRNCWLQCNYPSECRWGRQFGIHTPLDATYPALEIHSEPVDLDAAPQYIEEGVLTAESLHREVEGGTKTELWGLLASAKRRKSASGFQGGKGSPLASVDKVAENTARREDESGKDEDGDIVMANLDPALLELSCSSSPQTDLPLPIHTSTPPSPSVSQATVTSVAIDMLKDLMKRRSSWRKHKTSASVPGSEYPAPMLTVPNVVLAKEKDDVSMGDPEAMLEEFAPLERVRSRRVGVEMG